MTFTESPFSFVFTPSLIMVMQNGHADAMTEAILRAVRAATSIPGYPAARDLR